MPLSVSQRLRVVRQHQFVGRECERQLFREALDAPEFPFVVLHVFGPGGVGKTTLLGEFGQICADAQIPAFYLDARHLDPSPNGFEAALQALLGLTMLDFLGQGEVAADAFQDRDRHADRSQGTTLSMQRCVLFIDTYELLLSLDDWLRDDFFPKLPDQMLIVLAGRYPPTTAWRTDLGWQTLLYSLSLRNLSPQESRLYLAKQSIPDSQHQAVLEFTHGYPLALSLMTDVFAQNQTLEVQVETVPDVVKMLLEKFLEDVPTLLHRQALEACAIARLTTEALLGEMLGIAETHDLFKWLWGLSFMECGPIGLFPHDLARDVLIADLRWRNPDRYTELHQRARNYYTHRLAHTQGTEQHRILCDYIFLHRDNSAVKSGFTWHDPSRVLTDTLKASDPAVLTAMVAKHEGEDSARLAAHWLARQPRHVLVFRNLEHQPIGFVQMVALDQAHFEDLDADPGAIACWQYLQHHAPLRKGEGATMFRFWMADETYQAVSPLQSLIFINLVQYYRNTPGLAFTFLPCADPQFWAEMFAYGDLDRLSEADFEVGGRCYGVYGHDWRIVSLAAWHDLLARREIAASAAAARFTPAQEPLLVLSQSEFIDAVKEALRYFTRPDMLRQNPCLRSHLVVDQGTDSGSSERVSILQTLIQEAVASLRASPRDDKLYRALYRTYLNPAATQEQAAELLDLPFSTYRRHLKAGIERVADILWQREIS
ncbi:MAG: hypothetical protein WCD18_18795 [Thermosynechococcaceae cyanobacterium]